MTIEHWGRRYGPTFAFSLAGRPVVCFAAPDAINAILKERPDGFRRWGELEDVVERDRDQRPVHVRGRGLAPPAPARGHRAQHEPPAPLLRGHPDRQRPPAHAPTAQAGAPRSWTTSWPTASTSRPRWRSAMTSTRSSTATVNCSATSRACSRCWRGGRSPRSRTGATSSRRPTAPPSVRWRSSRVRSPGSSPMPRPGSRPGRSCARRPRTSSRACWRRRPTARTT